MAVSSTVRKESFTLDQVEDEFDFSFRALVASPGDIKCAVLTNGTQYLLTYLTDYTVAINSDGDGGTVTLDDATAVSKGTLTIYRETTNTQASDYEDYNAFPADTLERDLDKRTMIAQELEEQLLRTMTVPITSSLTSGALALPNPAANQIIGWNSGADGLENKTANSLGTLVLAAQSDAIAGTNNTKYMTPLRVMELLEGGNTTGSFSTLSIGSLVVIDNLIADTLSVSTIKITNSVAVLTVGTLASTSLSSGNVAFASLSSGTLSVGTASIGSLSLAHTANETLLFLDHNGAGMALDIDSEQADGGTIVNVINAGADALPWMLYRKDTVDGKLIMKLGDGRLWTDSTGVLRINPAADPANDGDGIVVGSQT